MTTVKCPCGFDSGVEKPKSGYNIGQMTQKLGMAWIMIQDGGSVWICRACEKLVNEAAVRISNILGSSYWVASSVLPRASKVKLPAEKG